MEFSYGIYGGVVLSTFRCFHSLGSDFVRAVARLSSILVTCAGCPDVTVAHVLPDWANGWEGRQELEKERLGEVSH